MSALSSLLLLADGRLPTGGHAHSGGVEEACAAGRVVAVDDLAAFLEGRLATTGEVDAGLAAAARRWACGPADLDGAWLLDAEAAARIPSPALRRAARIQGRGLRRAALRCWPSPALALLGEVHADGPMWPVALGTAAAAAGVDEAGVAGVARWSAVTGPAWAAVRLLGLDPLAVAGVLARLEIPTGVPADLPSLGAPLCEVGAEHHATWEVRLFAS